MGFDRWLGQALWDSIRHGDSDSHARELLSVSAVWEGLNRGGDPNGEGRLAKGEDDGFAEGRFTMKIMKAMKGERARLRRVKSEMYIRPTAGDCGRRMSASRCLDSGESSSLGSRPDYEYVLRVRNCSNGVRGGRNGVRRTAEVIGDRSGMFAAVPVA